ALLAAGRRRRAERDARRARRDTRERLREEALRTALGRPAPAHPDRTRARHAARDAPARRADGRRRPRARDRDPPNGGDAPQRAPHRGVDGHAPSPRRARPRRPHARARGRTPDQGGALMELLFGPGMLFRNAVLGGLVVALVCSLLGVYVVLRRLVLL